MGVSIGHCKKTIDLTYGGFMRLRYKVAYLLNKDFGLLYENWIKYNSDISDQEGNEKLQQLFDNGSLKDDTNDVLDFLFQPDCSGKLSNKGCKILYNVIKDYDDNKIIYGYYGVKDPIHFNDFKEIVKECCNTRRILQWY